MNYPQIINVFRSICLFCERKLLLFCLVFLISCCKSETSELFSKEMTEAGIDTPEYVHISKKEEEDIRGYYLQLPKGRYRQRDLIASIKKQLETHDWHIEDGLFEIFESMCVAEKDATLIHVTVIGTPTSYETTEDYFAENLVIVFSKKDDQYDRSATSFVPPTLNPEEIGSVLDAFAKQGIPVPKYRTLTGSLSPGFLSVRIYLAKRKYTNKDLKNLYHIELRKRNWRLDTHNTKERYLQFVKDEHKCIVSLIPIDEDASFLPEEIVDRVLVFVFYEE